MNTGEILHLLDAAGNERTILEAFRQRVADYLGITPEDIPMAREWTGAEISLLMGQTMEVDPTVATYKCEVKIEAFVRGSSAEGACRAFRIKLLAGLYGPDLALIEAVEYTP